MRSYKILLVLTPALHPNKGGVQMTTCKLGKYFSSQGHKVAVFSFAREGHKAPDEVQLHSALEEKGAANPHNHQELAKLLGAFSPDIVINQMPYDHSIGNTLLVNKNYLLIACLRNTLFSVKGDIDAYLNRLVPKALRPVLRNRFGKALLLGHHRRRHRADLERILEAYDYFVMFGPPNIEELRYFLPDYDEEKVFLIPNSIPSVADSVPPKQNRLLWLGRVAVEQKKADLIPEIWRRLAEKLPDWELDVVGDGPFLSSLEELVATEGLERINFHGRQQPDEFYQRSPIFFMTSAFEGFPNTLVEAQSYGSIPVVFNSYPVASWLINESQTGFLVKPFDVDEMVKRILALASSPHRDKLARQVMSGAREYEIERVGLLWHELFKEGLSRRKPATQPIKASSVDRS